MTFHSHIAYPRAQFHFYKDISLKCKILCYYMIGRRTPHGNPSLLRVGLLWVSKGWWFDSLTHAPTQ